MSEEKQKVKMSVFLEPEVARAAKAQAALQGAGVSAIVGKVFLCAHCGEPITDEFIVGRPKLVSQDRYSVFFHKNREECLKASGARVVYVPVCPKCNGPAYQEFEPHSLYESLVKRSVRFYCIRCDHHWDAAVQERDDLAKLLADK